MKKRGRPCSVCANARRLEIDAMDGPLGRVAAMFGITASSLGRHRRHAAPSVAASKAKRRAHAGAERVPVVVEADARTTARETLATLRMALRAASPQDVARLANAITAAAKFLARLEGELDLTHSMILRSPIWRDMTGRMERALVPFPDACKALADAFSEFRE